jgi:hypothetical protein
MYFIAGREEAAARRAQNTEFRSKWTAYMWLCREYEEARVCKFADIERDYTFHAKDTLTKQYIWKFEPRGRQARGGMHVAMIYPPNPANRELFATYLLALELRGIQSFADLRSLNRPSDDNHDPEQPTEECENAIVACVRRGLLNTDDRWIGVMEQVACTAHSAYQFVRFFASLLLHSQPSDPQALLDRYAERMMAPPHPERANDDAIRYQQLLRQMQRLLEDAGRTMAEFGLPEPIPDQRTVEERVEEELIPPVYDVYNANGDPIELTPEERLANAEARYNNECHPEQQRFIDAVFERLAELERPPVSNRV